MINSLQVRVIWSKTSVVLLRSPGIEWKGRDFELHHLREVMTSFQAKFLASTMKIIISSLPEL